MCRHLAWLGPPRTLNSLIYEPEYGLESQSYRPRMQRYGVVNADGFGVGWYLPGRDRPVRYRRAVPIWSDDNIRALAEVTTAGCLVAAVRTASAGMPVEESATAPFTRGGWLVSHNGRVAVEAVRPLVEPGEPESRCDSAWLAAAVFARVDAGAGLAEAVAEVVRTAGAADRQARLNLLVSDGTAVVASVWAETLWIRRGDGVPGGDGVLLASEPLEEGPGWEAVPDHRLVLATRHGIDIQELS
ncbi:ergothioneine biosynthesis protein EgtC [Rhizohabitans arisaemae]|uniref:ergothioneine biosynthesis protein EgtC n=1 Tax=Rhizohabitans arisaemae TaxID=2720610 RepID=UPI0024B1C06C|nr:ergothioneine biosynthesis protein EgtC [Rhizohabitans arisaemae]